MKIEIKSKNEEILYSCTDIGEGSKRYFKMQEYDYITLAFSVENPFYFKLGDGIDNELGLFELVDLYTPTYNTETGGYDYNLRLDAHYWKWKNKVFKYTPELFGQEASWSLTASLSVHLNVFLKNLKAWGFKFRETDYTYEIQPGYGETSKALTYSNTNLIDALTMMAEAWGCEWWVTDNVIHFGRAEYGTETTFEQNVNVENMSRSESETEYATRIIAFGGESNIPAKYRKDLIFTNDGNGSEVMDDFRKLSYEYFAPESIISPEKKTLTANAEDDDIGDKTRPLFFSFRLPLGEKLELGKSYEIDLTSVVLKADITGGEFTGTQKVDIVLATSASLFDTVASLEFEAVGASFTKNLTTISFKVEETYNGEMPNNLYISVNTSENVTDVNGRISGNASCKGQFTLVNSARSANTSITVLTGENEGQTYQGVFNPDFFTGDSANVIKLTDGTLGKGEQYQVNNLVRSLVPDNYFTAPKTEATIDGVVSKRLMLPEDTPYIDAVEGLDMSQIVEKIITVDDIFPKRIGTISEVSTVDRDIQDDGEVTGTFKAYQYKDSGLVFDKKYVIKDDTLKITFQSGLLNGLTFEVQFEPEDSEKQTWEIVRNENYGRPLPDNIAYPQAGDKYILTGFDVEFVSDVYVPEAEQELKEYAIKAAEESYNRSFTYTVTMKPDYMWNGGEPKSFDLGDKIKLINKAYFEGSRSGRILGYEYPLDKPYDNPVYTVGDSPAYSRIGALEKKVETLQYGGKTYTGSGTSTGGGTSVYVIGSNDKTAWTDRNVLSSLRSKKEFISKTSEDSTSYLIRFLAGAEFGRFASGVAGGKISPDGAAELLTLLLRGALTIGDYQVKKSGAKIDEEGVADLLSILVRSAIESDNFSTGALGTGFCLKKDENGDSYLEIDRLLVRKVATFIELHIQQIKHVGGQIILTPASMSCAKVEDKGDFYRCYFENTDGEKTIEQEFVVGDLARAQTFNVKEGVNDNVTNTYYWRAVVGTGDNYIDLSKTDCDAGSTEPKAGDDIVQLGNKSDATRQAAIILSAYGNDAPYFKLYRGINSYSLDGKEFVSFSRSEVMIIADTIRFSSGETIEEYINNVTGGLVVDVETAKKAAEEAQKAAAQASAEASEAVERLDKWASDGIISPTEKQSLKDEIARIDADKTQVSNGYAKYNLGTPTDYNNAHTAYRAVLVTLTASTPETISIPSDFATKQTAYYTQRTNALTAISNAARDYAETISNDLATYKKTVSSQFEQTNNSITAAVTSTKEYTDNAISGIQIGGRNLIAISNIVDGYIRAENGNYYSVKDGYNYCSKDFIPAKYGYYTLTLYNSISVDRCAGAIHCYDSSKKWLGICLSSITWTSPKTKTFQTLENTKYIKFTLIKGNVEGNWKLETGTKSTDWSPAPEDADNALTEYKKEVTAQFSVLEGEISSKVSSTEMTTIKQEILNSAATDATNKANQAKNDAITTAGQNADKKYATITTVSSMQTSITQLSNEISLRAYKSEVTAVQNNLNQINSNLSSLTTRVSEAEIALQPDNIWIGISSKVTTTSKVNNIVPDSCFEDANYSLLYSGGSRVSAATANNSCPTSYCMKSTVGTIYAKSYVNVNVGEKYYVTALVNAEKCNYNVTVGLRIKLKNETYKYIELDAIESKTKGWNTLSGYITIPTDSISASICFSIKGTSNLGEAYFTKVYAYKVDESVNQNYALLTSTEKKLTTFSNISNQTWNVYNITGLKKGDIITVSFEYEASNLNFNTTTEHTAKINCLFGPSYGWAGTTFDLKSNGSGKYISKPITVGGTATETTKDNIFFRLDYISSVLQDNKPIGYFRVWNLKVEKGERSTPWSAAPSDYSTTEEIKAGMQITDKGFNFFGQEFNFSGRISVGDLDPTIIEDGYLRASLIEADALVVKTLNASNTDGVSTLVNKDGMKMTQGSNVLFKLTSNKATVGTTRYYAQMDLTTVYSDGSTLQGTLTPESLFLRGKTKSTDKTLKTTLMYNGLMVYDENGTGLTVNTKGIQLTYCGKTQGGSDVCSVIHYGKCILTAQISALGSFVHYIGGGIPNVSGTPIEFSVAKTATGTYKVTHNIGDITYKVNIQAISNGALSTALVENFLSTSFTYTVQSFNGSTWATKDGGVFLFVYYESPKLFTF